MKKILSVMMAMALLVGCFVFGINAMAEDAPEITLEKGVTATIPKLGSDETSVKLAKFVPTEDGWYTFTADTEYKNTSSSADQELPGGVFSVDLYEDDSMATQGVAFFMDISSLDEATKKQYEDAGIDVEHFSTLKTAAKLEAGKTYYVVAYQDGAEDFTTGITVEKHTHTIKQLERKNDTLMPDGMYETCEEWYCTYDELITPYTVKYEVIEGANQTIGRGETLKVTANGSYEKFRGLQVDGEDVSESEYTSSEGSTVVTMNAEYLDTLKAGKHTLTFVYNDGEATTDFTIEEAAKKSEKKETNTSKLSPATGNEPVFAAFAAMLAGGLALAVIRRKRVTE